MTRDFDTVFRGIKDMCEQMNGTQDEFQITTLTSANMRLIAGVNKHECCAILKLNVLRAASIGMVICGALRNGELYLGRLERDSVSEEQRKT